MGLRLVAHYFDRGEALVVSSALDAAGIPAFVHGLDLLTMQPFYEFAFGGCRVVVSEDDLAQAVEVIREARRKPIFEGERLVTRHHIAFGVAPILTFILWDWILFLPYRGHEWRSVEGQE